MTDANRPSDVSWPENKSFAFSVFDDTDFSTMGNVPELYAFLIDRGILVTKSVWPLSGQQSTSWWGASCEDHAYLDWVHEIKARGVEIAFHNATWETSERTKIVDGLDRFASLFGAPPSSYACHAQCRENLYWGRGRLSPGINRLVYDAMGGFRNKAYYQGHVEGSPWFWGDICRSSIKYVRNFVYQGINTLAACPIMPYHDPERPYVAHWFASSEGQDCRVFTELLSEPNQDLLEEEGGACVVYTHFGAHFHEDGALNSRFRELIERLSKKNGWFVPVSTLLDYLLQVNGLRSVTANERTALERRWLMDRARFHLAGRRSKG